MLVSSGFQVKDTTEAVAFLLYGAPSPCMTMGHVLLSHPGELRTWTGKASSFGSFGLTEAQKAAGLWPKISRNKWR